MRWLDALSRVGTPRGWQRFHAAMALHWLVSVPVVVFTPLKTSIVYLIFVSLMTAFSGEMAALHGVTVQRMAEDDGEA